MNRTFPARASSLRDVRAYIRERAEQEEFIPEVADDLVLAVSEACANAIRHSSSPKLEVTWQSVENGAEVRVKDQGIFQSPRRGESGSLGRYGLDIHIMKSLVNEVSIQPGTQSQPGTQVNLIMYKRSVAQTSQLPGVQT